MGTGAPAPTAKGKGDLTIPFVVPDMSYPYWNSHLMARAKQVKI